MDSRSRQTQHSRNERRDVGRYAIAGLCSSLVGLGLARFAYSPLIPALISAKWFRASDVIYFGAANLVGYLVGAIVARPIAVRVNAIRVLRLMMVLATLTCFAGSEPLSFVWFLAWRVLAGLAGGVIMVLAATTILSHVPAARRGIIGGVIFAGVGLGIIVSGTLVPLLLREGLRDTWLGLGALSGLATLISWMGWPKEGDPAQLTETPRAARHELRATRALFIEYGLNASGLVPHMIFLVDFVARGLGQGIATGSQYWVVYGLAAVVGPLITGHLADRAGFGPALRVSLLLQAVAVVLPSVSTTAASLILSSAVIGGFTPGIVPVVLGRIHELLPHSVVEQRAAWSHATTSFALFQAAGAYGFAWLFDHGENNYLLLFRLAGVTLLGALVIDLIAVTFWAKSR